MLIVHSSALLGQNENSICTMLEQCLKKIKHASSNLKENIKTVSDLVHAKALEVYWVCWEKGNTELLSLAKGWTFIAMIDISQPSSRLTHSVLILQRYAASSIY